MVFSGAWPACPSRHARACLPHPQPHAGLLPGRCRHPGTHRQKHPTNSLSALCSWLPLPWGTPIPRLPSWGTKALKKLTPGRDGAVKPQGCLRVVVTVGGLQEKSVVKAKHKTPRMKSGKLEKVAGGTRTLGWKTEERCGSHSSFP